MTENNVPTDIKKLSFEAALSQLEEIVRELESGRGALDDAINAYARGAHLKSHCESKLDYAWVTRQLMDVADECCEGRVVSLLEGGYDLDALRDSAMTHVRTLMDV